MAMLEVRLGENGSVVFYTAVRPNTPTLEILCDNPSWVLQQLQELEDDTILAKQQARIDYLQGQMVNAEQEIQNHQAAIEAKKANGK